MTLTVALKVPEAAARLGRSERTVWRQIRAGELRTQREGRRVLVLVDWTWTRDGLTQRQGGGYVRRPLHT